MLPESSNTITTSIPLAAGGSLCKSTKGGRQQQNEPANQYG